MIVIVCGGRDFTDRDWLFRELDRLHAELHFTLVVEGGQRTVKPKLGGADFFAHEWAVSRGIPTARENANWRDLSHPDARILVNKARRRYDANAGHRRNALMLEKYKPQRVVAFPGGPGTRNMMELARAAGVEVIEVKK